MIKLSLPYILIALVAVGAYNYSQIFVSYDFDNYYGKSIGGQAHDFKLQDLSGSSVSLSDFKGKFLILTFGFTKCTGTCPLTLQRLKNLSKNISKSPLQNIHFAFVSFDRIGTKKET